MNRYIERPDMSGVMASLKDFQVATVEYAFRRLYLDDDSTRRFLVADEVGLGKTVVARGIIGKAIEHLWDKVGRIDVVYICSSSDIARQNIRRLKLEVPGNPEFARASRITLLPLEIRDLKHKRVNFVSFTPGTSFDLKSNLGTADERILLYWLLRGSWHADGTGALNVLQGTAETERFRSKVKYFERDRIEPSLAKAFAAALETRVAADTAQGKVDLRTRFTQLTEEFRDARKKFHGDAAKQRSGIVGELRSILAMTCLHALEPDLIILDEFQRFKHLLRGDDQAAELARSLFEYSDGDSHARVLLLSATPYKMYTLAHEAAEDDHYRDFLETLAFLRHDQTASQHTKRLLDDYRREMHRLANGTAQLDRLSAIKDALQAELRSVMARTERLACSDDRNGMLVQVPCESVQLQSGDVRSYVELMRIAERLNQTDVLTFWKAAPYLLNFMDEYELKLAFNTALEDRHAARDLVPLLAQSSKALLRWDDVQAYAQVDPTNARLRGLCKDVLEAGAWRLLWVPPSLPYYQSDGPFSDPALQNFTKRLIFSCWRVVPKVIASLVSYEAERQMILSHEPTAQNTPDARKARRGLLRFAKGTRLTGMPVLALLYPCRTLAALCDPLTLAISAEGTPVRARALEWAAQKIEPLLSALTATAPSEGPVDETWYWAAPILLDCEHRLAPTAAWFQRSKLAELWKHASDDHEDDTGWAEHVELARVAAQGRLTSLGRPPPDLLEFLAEVSLGGPAVCALRSLWRTTGGPAPEPDLDASICDSAAHVAWAMRALFNLPEVMAMVRGLMPAEPYWRRVLQYCVEGNLQAVLDEYAHVLLESEQLLSCGVNTKVHDLASAMRTAITLRTANISVESISATNAEAVSTKTKTGAAPETPVTRESHNFRARFAVRFGNERAEDTKDVTRADHVRRAFNSPFWPFILATTSVGQEGLDFHPYAHAVVHWDLPSNPVDLEQREGRVHRYKGHAVRKNLAAHYGFSAMLATSSDIARDPWRSLFRTAAGERDAHASDLVPYWIYTIPGGAKIERHVPVLPLSRDEHKLTALRRSLVLYRMVFGQPRQEDLLRYLLENVAEPELQPLLERLKLDLAPPVGA